MLLNHTCALATAVCLLLSIHDAGAQGLSPMRKSGGTPGESKGLYLSVANPYDRPMTFDVIPMEADLKTRANDAEARPGRIRVGANRSRRIVFIFGVPESGKREVSLCVTPSDPEGTIVTRVCGTYAGWRTR